MRFKFFVLALFLSLILSSLVSAEFCSPFTINMTISPSVLDVGDGVCSGEIAFAPSSDFLLNVSLVDNSSGEVVFYQTYGSGLLGVGVPVNFYPSSSIQDGFYYLNFSWSRIKYVDMSNSGLNGLFDSGDYQFLCPTAKTGSKMFYYTGVSDGLSGCNYESLLRDGNYSSKNQFTTGNIETFVNDGCSGSSKLDDDFFDTDFIVGGRVPEGSSYHPTFSCNAGVGSVFESFWNVGVYSCVSAFGYNDVLTVSSCSNGLSAPSGVCNDASGSFRSDVFPVVYQSDSRDVVDFESVGLDFSGSLSWVSLTEDCFTDGFYNFKPVQNIIVSDGDNPKLSVNFSVTDNVSLHQNPSNCSPVLVSVRLLKDNVFFDCSGSCPEKQFLVNDTGVYLFEFADVFDLDPDANYTFNVSYQQEGGLAVYSESSDDRFVDRDEFSSCGDGVCNVDWGEDALSCGVDCNPRFSVVDGGESVSQGSKDYVNPDSEGVVGTGTDFLNTGGFVVSDDSGFIVGAGGLNWMFIFVNDINIGD